MYTTYTWHDSYIRARNRWNNPWDSVMWHIHTCDMTHLYLWHICDETRSHVWHVSFIYTAYCIWSVTSTQSPISISLVSVQRNVVKETERTRSSIESWDSRNDTPNAIGCTSEEWVERTWCDSFKYDADMNELRHTYEGVISQKLSWYLDSTYEWDTLHIWKRNKLSLYVITHPYMMQHFHMCDVSHIRRGTSSACVAWLNHIWRNTFMCVTCHTYTWGKSWACVALLSLIYDATLSFVWRDSFTCVRCSIHITHWICGHTCVMTHSYRRRIVAKILEILYCKSSKECDSSMCGTRLIRIYDIRMAWRIRMCDMTHSYIPARSGSKDPWDSVLWVIHGTWFIHMWDITHAYLWHTRGMTHSNVWNDSFIYTGEESVERSLRFQHAYMCGHVLWHDAFIRVPWLVHVSVSEIIHAYQ